MKETGWQPPDKERKWAGNFDREAGKFVRLAEPKHPRREPKPKAATVPAVAAGPDVTAEIGQLRAQMEEMQAELRRIAAQGALDDRETAAEPESRPVSCKPAKARSETPAPSTSSGSP